jgi:hypothetical protein
MFAKSSYKKYFIAILLIIFAIYCQLTWRKLGIAPHLPGLRADFYPEFINEKTHREILEVIKEMKVFPTNAQDLQVCIETNDIHL